MRQAAQTPSLGVVMDPIADIHPKKDTTLAILLAAGRRGWPVHYFELGDLYLRDGEARGRGRPLQVRDDPHDWFTLGPAEDIALASLDWLLMRKDPPFDAEYLYATYVLERAEAAGAQVCNRPAGLRDANEKMFTAWFAHCCPPTLIDRAADRLHAFIDEHGDCILKPLDGMGGASVFRVRSDDANRNVIVETLTAHGRRRIVAQRYLPEIREGDKRILLIDGIPLPYALARLAAPGETRANLAAGGRGVGVPLSERDRWICDEVGPTLRQRGLRFVGLDVIGDWLTEINVTSPTCARELDALYGLDIGGRLLDALTADRS